MIPLLLTLLLSTDPGTCVQTDGQAGVYDGSTADDTGCITPTEYEALYSPPGLQAAGVIVDWWMTDNTHAVIVFPEGLQTVVEYNPMDRPHTAGPQPDPTHTTVRSWWRRMVR